MICGTIALNTEQVTAPLWVLHCEVDEIARDADLRCHLEAFPTEPLKHQLLKLGVWLASARLSWFKLSVLGVFEICPKGMHARLRSVAHPNVTWSHRGEHLDPVLCASE